LTSKPSPNASPPPHDFSLPVPRASRFPGRAGKAACGGGGGREGERGGEPAAGHSARNHRHHSLINLFD
jgi:hypothetical protein